MKLMLFASIKNIVKGYLQNYSTELFLKKSQIMMINRIIKINSFLLTKNNEVLIKFEADKCIVENAIW